jgi:hypothetical protein
MSRILKAYGLGYLALTAPRLLGFIPLLISKNATYRAKLEKVSIKKGIPNQSVC